MKLEDVISDSVLRYPMLYAGADYQKSRWSILDHLFLTIGTGYEWHTDGYLYDMYRDYEKEPLATEIPDGFFTERRDTLPSPYPISEYSALSEILNGRTRSFHVDNFDLVPLPDWLDGCLEIAIYARNYYLDPSSTETHVYGESKNVHGMNVDILLWKKGIEKEPFWIKNMKDGETVEQYAARIWNDYKAKQLSILNKFIKKFGYRRNHAT